MAGDPPSVYEKEPFVASSLRRFVALLVLALAVFVTCALFVVLQEQIPAQQTLPSSRLAGGIDFEAMFDSISASAVAEAHGRVVEAPGRISGSAAEHSLSQWVEQAFRRLGLQVIIQPFEATVPVTKWCQISEAGGSSISEVSITPFWPNLVRTCTTGPAGIVGEVIDAGDGSLGDLEGRDIKGNIALVHLTPGSSWLDAAKLGAAAILFRPAADPRAYAQKVLSFPADLPRFLVVGRGDALVGKRVRLLSRVDWVVEEVRNVYGVLRPSQPARESLTLLAHTDTWSPVPELAPGYHEGSGVVSLLMMAHALNAQREGLGRTVIFGALSAHYQAAEGGRRLLDALGPRTAVKENQQLLADRVAAAGQQVKILESAAQALRSEGFWRLDGRAEASRWQRYGVDAKKALSAVANRQIYRYVRSAQRDQELRRVAWVKAGRPSTGPLFHSQRAMSNRVRRAASAAGSNLVLLKQRFGDVLEASYCRQRLPAMIAESIAVARRQLRTQQASVQFSRLLGETKTNYFFFLAPSGSGQRLGYRGDLTLCSDLERARDAVVGRWLSWRGEAGGTAIGSNYIVNRQHDGDNRHIGKSYLQQWSPPASTLGVDPPWVMYRAGYGAFEFSGNQYPASYQTPLDRHIDHADLTAQTQLLTALAAQIAAGGEPMDTPGKASAGIVIWLSDFSGDVLTVSGANALLPNQPVDDAMVVLKGVRPNGPTFIRKARGGLFRFPAVDASTVGTMLVDAYSLDQSTGRITGARDLGAEGQRFPTLRGRREIYYTPETRVTVLLTRLAPADIYRTIGSAGDPLTVEVLDARFRTQPAKFSLSEYWEQGATVFMPPGGAFYLRLKDLPLIRSRPSRVYEKKGLYTRGFLMNHHPGDFHGQDEFWGPGYLAGAMRRVVNQELDGAISVARCNRWRLDNQLQSGLADPVNIELAQRADELLQRGIGAETERNYSASYRALSSSLAISQRVYPSVRLAIYDAVGGILLYLFLLVPFSFFAERLLFAFNDVRVRLLGVFAIFLAVFGVIRVTHPAYGLMSSSLIVLIGFVIFILCGMILGFVLGKFTEQIRSLRREGAGEVESQSDVSRMSASGAAFSLGVGNMRKRKVRTAYTVATVVLISFCLVCFTSPRPQLKDRQVAVGGSPFNGLLLRSPADVEAARLRFAEYGQVVARKARPIEAVVTHAPPGRPTRAAKLEGIVYVEPGEIEVSALGECLLPASKWFGPADRNICYIADTMADALGINPATVLERNVHVSVGERQFVVYGVFDAVEVDAMRDVDGASFLPETKSVLSPQQREREHVKQLAGQPGGQDTAAQYVAASKVILVPLNSEAGGDFTSAVVRFHDQPYGSMHQIIGQTMDRAPTFVRYAVDGVAFFGARLRSMGLEGYVDIVVPLLVASCIVFNTMLGNVHERKNEIAVYSAVGLSPRHVFYLFLAESVVYAVLGVVGGYLLALGMQWASQWGVAGLELTIDYSSRSAIYVTLVLMLAVVLSCFVPAYQAARVASPSERVSWALPAPLGPGRLRYDLPFTYIGRDILAAVPFLAGWFEAHGEDSSGAFAAAPARVNVRWESGRPVFTVAARVWLRPYDLGVSQRVNVTLSPSEEPTVYMVSIGIDQLSGSDTSWQRTNTRFVGLLRRHLLSWRAASARRKQLLFEQCVEGLV